jgi:DNA-binding response OmpR family regulator
MSSFLTKAVLKIKSIAEIFEFETLRKFSWLFLVVIFLVSYIAVNKVLARRMSKRIAEPENNDIPKLDEFVFGNLRINNSTHQVFFENNEIKLPRKEFELLYFLAANREIVFSKEKLYDKIWGEDMYGDIGTVAVHIKRLREKIEKNPSEPEYIQTIRGTGYKFTS